MTDFPIPTRDGPKVGDPCAGENILFEQQLREGCRAFSTKPNEEPNVGIMAQLNTIKTQKEKEIQSSIDQAKDMSIRFGRLKRETAQSLKKLKATEKKKWHLRKKMMKAGRNAQNEQQMDQIDRDLTVLRANYDDKIQQEQQQKKAYDDFLTLNLKGKNTVLQRCRRTLKNFGESMEKVVGAKTDYKAGDPMNEKKEFRSCQEELDALAQKVDVEERELLATAERKKVILDTKSHATQLDSDLLRFQYTIPKITLSPVHPHVEEPPHPEKQPPKPEEFPKFIAPCIRNLDNIRLPNPVLSPAEQAFEDEGARFNHNGVLKWCTFIDNPSLESKLGKGSPTAVISDQVDHFIHEYKSMLGGTQLGAKMGVI